MELDEDQFNDLAKEYIKKWIILGDEPLTLNNFDLINRVGFSLSLEPQIPQNEAEEKKAENGTFNLYSNHIKIMKPILDQIKRRCPTNVQMTVIPVVLYYENNIYERTVFRVIDRKGVNRFIDNVGRYYETFNDWKRNNLLPPGKVEYPKDGKLTRNDKKPSNVCFMNTPANSEWATFWGVMDSSSGLIGTGLTVLKFIPIPAVQLVSTIGIPILSAYGVGRSAAKLYDKSTHGQTINPFKDSESRTLWLLLSANALNLGSTFATMKLSSMAAKGVIPSEGFKAFVNVVNGTSVAINGLSVINHTCFMINNYKKMSKKEVILTVIEICYWLGMSFKFKSSNRIIKDAQNNAFSELSENFSTEDKSILGKLRTEYGDQVLLEKICNEANSCGVECNQSLNNLLQQFKKSSNHNQSQNEARNLASNGSGNTNSDHSSNSASNNSENATPKSDSSKSAHFGLGVFFEVLKETEFPSQQIAFDLQQIIKDLPDFILRYSEGLANKICDANKWDVVKTSGTLLATITGFAKLKFNDVERLYNYARNRRNEPPGGEEEEMLESLDDDNDFSLTERCLWEKVLKQLTDEEEEFICSIVEQLDNMKSIREIVGAVVIGIGLGPASLLQAIKKSEMRFGSDNGTTQHARLRSASNFNRS